MLLQRNLRAFSTLATILIILISLIVGGLLSYMFTIASFIKIPEDTTVTITGVYFNREDGRSFKLTVMNPSYSPRDANITGIALNLKGESKLYNIVGTEPSIENGIVVPKGEEVDITCLRAEKDGDHVSWGRLAGEFAGQNITVHVFSRNSAAANVEASVPLVRFYILDTDFNAEISFDRFNITILNDMNSEINLTINEITVSGIDLSEEDISPKLPQVVHLGGEYIRFTCNKSWYNLAQTLLTVSTEEGYVCVEEVALPRVSTEIQLVNINENHTDHFNVTVSNSAESDGAVNVESITCRLEDGAIIKRDYPSVRIAPNSTGTFKFDWGWTEYRAKEINVTVFLTQGFQTDVKTIETPPRVIIAVSNKNGLFNLEDKTHFNITIQNHPSSIEDINITKIIVDSEEISGTNAYPELPYGPVEPGQEKSFYCNISDWTEYAGDGAGDGLAFKIHAVNQNSESYELAFTTAPPVAELNITSITHMIIGETRYINITIENMNYSISSLTVSKVTMKLPDKPEAIEQIFPDDQIIISPGEKATLFYAFDWTEYLGDHITVTVISKEEVEFSWQGTDW